MRWRNVPAPEPHVVGLAIGLLAQLVVPVKLFAHDWLSRRIGLILVVGGLSLAASAVKTVAEVDLEAPDRVVVGGPYTYSRNPMYLAWDAIYLGISLLTNAVWPLLRSPAVLAWSHLQIVKEEHNLERRFGAEYREYKRKTRRYL